jgi:hypothetical protein
LFGAVPPVNYSIFNDSQLIEMGYEIYLDKLKKGEVVRFPDLYYNAHLVDPSIPDAPVWIRMIAFPLKDFMGNSETYVLMHQNIQSKKQQKKH